MVLGRVIFRKSVLMRVKLRLYRVQNASLGGGGVCAEWNHGGGVLKSEDGVFDLFLFVGDGDDGSVVWELVGFDVESWWSWCWLFEWWERRAW